MKRPIVRFSMDSESQWVAEMACGHTQHTRHNPPFSERPWVETADYWDVYWDVTRAVKRRFDAEGISIPLPQREVHVHKLD